MENFSITSELNFPVPKTIPTSDSISSRKVRHSIELRLGNEMTLQSGKELGTSLKKFSFSN